MPRIILVVTCIPFCWLGMQVVHEVGHVLGATATGGTIEQVVLHPLAISRTDLADNPHPLVVAWSGPLIGVVLPLIVAVAYRLKLFSGWHLIQFFAGFCLIANGVYIGLGSLFHIGDAGDMIRHMFSVS